MGVHFRGGMAVLLCLCASPAVLAQTPAPVPEWHYSEGHLLNAYTKDQLPQWDRVVGISTQTDPKFEGGDAYATSAGPSFDIRYYDIAFASAGEGFGVNFLHEKTARAGFAVVYDLGRNNEDDHFLTGLGNYGISPGVKVFAEYLLFPVTFRAALAHYFGGQGGYVGDLSIYTPVAGKDNVYFLFAGPSMRFADATNLRHVFGVNAAQSANSGYPQHALGGGVRSYSFGLSGGYFFSRHWLLEAFVAGAHLVGGAASAPFVQQPGELDMQMTVAYRW